jgi:hypothetical protein
VPTQGGAQVLILWEALILGMPHSKGIISTQNSRQQVFLTIVEIIKFLKKKG